MHPKEELRQLQKRRAGRDLSGAGVGRAGQAEDRALTAGPAARAVDSEERRRLHANGTDRKTESTFF